MSAEDQSPPPLVARRGDLVVLTSTSRTAYVRGEDSSAERVEIGIVTSVTRDGTVKQWASPFRSDDEDPRPRDLPRIGLDKVLIVHQQDIDVAGAMTAYRSRRWPNTESQAVRPLESVEQARTLLRPFLTGGSSG